jgi:hypothetical protein
MTRDAGPIALPGASAMMTGDWNSRAGTVYMNQDLGMRRCDFIDILAARWQLEIAIIHANGENCDE